LDEYRLVEEKLVDGIPEPNKKPLDEDVPEVGIVMHADIAIAPRLHDITAAIRATQVIRLIIFPLGDFANRRKSAAVARDNSLELGRPPRCMLTSTPRERPLTMEPAGYSTRARDWTAMTVKRAVLLAVCAGAATGCFWEKRPTQVMVTPVTGDVHPAKPPDCVMPVLTQEPTVAYQQIAIVEAWADVNESPDNVLPELKRQACATGAQALLIVSGKKQDPKSLLYGVTPNESETEVSSENRTANGSATYINKMQYRPRVGEEGHTGYYIDAIAIDYVNGANTAASGQPSGP
jgi:hypothetical protein